MNAASTDVWGVYDLCTDNPECLGVKLGLLVNPQGKQVEIYRSGRDVEALESPATIDCGEVMPGFVLSMDRIWT